MAQYVHHIPGRLRLKIAALKRNTQAAANVERMLAEFDGVMRSEVNPVTGSLLIHYDAERTHAEAILSHLKAHAIVSEHTSLRTIPLKQKGGDIVVGTLGNIGGAAGKALLGFAVEKAVERSAVALIGAIL